MKILITICARGGSKGIPGKNIKLLDGKPLIYYSLKTASLFSKKYDADIFLSTDSIIIRRIVESLNIENVYTNYSRPAELATDSSGKLEAILDVKKYAEKTKNIEYDYLIDLDVTSPLRTVSDIEEGLSMLKKSKAFNLFSVNIAGRNPYFNMVEKNAEGFYSLCKEGVFLSRQTAPKVYALNASFYIYNKSFFSAGFKKVTTSKSLIYEMPHLCFDLDENIDFDFIEYLLLNNKLDFSLDK
jgi:CMP-N-acetylneuraminic acid synthetase